MRVSFAIPSFIALAAALGLPGATLAQTAHDSAPGLTFEQAQTRTAYARKQMQAAQRKLDQLERKEKDAYSDLSDMQQRYEEAKSAAQLATDERRAAEAELEQARGRWQQESAHLQRIHEENQARRRP